MLVDVVSVGVSAVSRRSVPAISWCAMFAVRRSGLVGWCSVQKEALQIFKVLGCRMRKDESQTVTYKRK